MTLVERLAWLLLLVVLAIAAWRISQGEPPPGTIPPSQGGGSPSTALVDENISEESSDESTRARSEPRSEETFARLFGYRPPAPRTVPQEVVVVEQPTTEISRDLVLLGFVVTDRDERVYTFREAATELIFIFSVGQTQGQWTLLSVDDIGFVFAREGVGEVIVER